VFQRRI